MFSYSHFLSPALLGFSPLSQKTCKSPLGQLLQDKVTMLRTKSLLKYNTVERCTPESLTPEPGKRRVNIRIDTPGITAKASSKHPAMKPGRNTDADGGNKQLPSLTRGRRLTLAKPYLRSGTHSPRTTLARSHTPTPAGIRSPLPSPKKAVIPRFEENGVLGVVGNSTSGVPQSSPLPPVQGQTLTEQWLKELRDFARSVEKRATDWYEELDYEGKGFITRQDILDKLRLQKYISPKFQYLDHKKAAFFGENQKESTFNSIKGSAQQALGYTERMLAETEDTYSLLNVQCADCLTKADITNLVCVFEFNSTSEILQDDLICISKVFERENLQVNTICGEIAEVKVDFHRFLTYLPFFMRLHLTVIKSLRI